MPDTELNEDVARLERALARERVARKEAERLLEERSLALYESNRSLLKLTQELEQQVAQRTTEMQKAVARAEASTRSKGEFLAMMSHEIRTPMNGILGMAQLLDLTELTAEQRGFVGTIRASGDALLVLINDILDFSKIEAGKLELEDRSFQLEMVLQHTLELHRPLAERKGLRLEMRLDPDLPAHVSGDRTRLRQVITNLLSNAIKFTEHGSVELEARIADQNTEGIRLEVTVRDSGIGIPSSRLDRLFQAFSQVDTSTTRKYGGTGLGLAICEKLCKAMGGSIRVTSVDGRGTTFTFDVWLGHGQAAAETVPGELGPVSSAARPSLRVLVVDDDHINRTMAVAMLDKLGIRGDVAKDGVDAVEKVAAQDYDIVLMDMQMPDMDGVEATQAIRSLPLPHQPHIIALTANAFASDRERCLQAGMNDFLAKPFRMDALRALLAAFAH